MFCVNVKQITKLCLYALILLESRKFRFRFDSLDMWIDTHMDVTENKEQNKRATKEDSSLLGC
jgi:hypothetical protein